MYLGALIGSYRVTRELGVGGMGVVYEGEHALLGRKVAIKVLLPQMSANQEIVRRFFNEAKAATRIADPGIVQVYDFGAHADGAAYIVMELLGGDSLGRRLETIGRFKPLDAIRLARQIATSLSAAHAQGIIHRDLKPENVFIVGDLAVTGGERTKVLDFGIAKLSQQTDAWKTQTGAVLGTPLYMSPEQCRGTGTVDARSDVYALGCLIMTMVTGRPPFVHEGCGDLIVAHLREAPPLAASRVPGITPGIDKVLQRCLAKSPDARFGSMIELGEALAEAERDIVRAASSTTLLPASFSISFKATPTTLGGSAAEVIRGGGRRAARAVRIIAVAACVLALVGVAGSSLHSPAPRAVEAALARPDTKADPFAQSPPMPDSVEPHDDAFALLSLGRRHQDADRIASALAAYDKAAAATNDPRTRELATRLAGDMRARLSHLTLALPAGRAVAGIALTCDGQVVVANEPIPIDGGDHEIVARAPGRVEWSEIVRVPTETTDVALEIPRLTRPPAPTPVSAETTTSPASP